MSMSSVRHRAPRRRPRGISTAEVLAGTALGLFILAGVYSFHLAQMKALAAQRSYGESLSVTRTVVDLLTRELRMASYDPTGTALPTSPGPTCPGVKQGLIEARPGEIRFQQDLDGDGALTSTAEDVTWVVAGDRLLRSDGGNLPVTLVEGVAADGFVLQYYDASNPPVELVPTGSPAALTASQRNCVAKVRVHIHASLPNPSPGSGQPLESLAEAEIAIRNRSLTNF